MFLSAIDPLRDDAAQELHEFLLVIVDLPPFLRHEARVQVDVLCEEIVTRSSSGSTAGAARNIEQMRDFTGS
ncbi:MAG: hypothetical protein MR959_04955 [Selenomonas bovis]|nr:hypothetical protein [Selenomonas bovis]